MLLFLAKLPLDNNPNDLNLATSPLKIAKLRFRFMLSLATASVDAGKRVTKLRQATNSF